MGDEAYKNMLQSAGLKTRPYEEVAKDWEKKSSEWYHALIAEEELPIVLAIPSLNIYACTRCKLVADDGSEAQGELERESSSLRCAFYIKEKHLRKFCVSIMLFAFYVTCLAKMGNELDAEIQIDYEPIHTHITQGSQSRNAIATSAVEDVVWYGMKYLLRFLLIWI